MTKVSIKRATDDRVSNDQAMRISSKRASKEMTKTEAAFDTRRAGRKIGSDVSSRVRGLSQMSSRERL